MKKKLLVVLFAMALLTAAAVTMVSAATIPAEVQARFGLQPGGDTTAAAQTTAFESVTYDRGPHLCSVTMGDNPEAY